MSPAQLLARLNGGGSEKDGADDGIMGYVRFSLTFELCYCSYEVSGNDTKASLASGDGH